MPTYEYACAKCGERFDVYQSFSDEPLKKHAACGGKLTKVFGPVGIVLKGSGFYKTDNRSSSSAKAAKKDSDGGSSDSGSVSTDSGSGGNGDSKASPATSDSKSGAEKAGSTKKADVKPAAKSKSA